MESYDSVRLFD